MKQGIFTVASNRNIAANTWEMVLLGDTSGITAPGQFVNIQLDGMFLRRPISVCHWEEGSLTIVYKAVGRGTEHMTTLGTGAELDILTGLGNGYDLTKCGGKILLIGGGAGVAPMYGLCETLVKSGKQIKVILGFNTADEVYYAEKFEKLGADTVITTVDGSLGVQGFVTAAMDCDYDYFCTCGPEPMLKAVYAASKTSGQMSFEERMGCGFGACVGCTCETKYGHKRICKDGPVLEKEEIIW